MKTIQGLLLIGLFCVSAALADPPDTLWTHTYGGSAADGCSYMLPLSDGGYLLGGFTQSYGAGNTDWWLIRTDAAGNMIWSRTYGGTGAEFPAEIQPLYSGGFIACGPSQSYGAGDYDFWLMALSDAGDSLWSRTYGFSGYDRCETIRVLEDGFVMAGYTDHFGVYDSWIIRTDLSGNPLWDHIFGGAGQDRVLDMAIAADGGFLLLGFSNSYGSGGDDYWLTKFSPAGDSLWSRFYGGSGGEACRVIVPLANGNYLIPGNSSSFASGMSDFWPLIVNADGDSLWSRTFGGANNEIGYSGCELPDGGLVLSGHTNSFGAGSYDAWLVRTNAAGDSIWSTTIGGTGIDYAYAITLESDHSVTFTGNTESYGAGAADVWLVRTEPIELLDAHHGFIPHPSSFSLSAYPNPFNPSTTISFSLANTTNAQLKVFDISGRLVTILADEFFSTGIHELSFDGHSYPSGVYFVRVATPTQSQTIKLQLLK